ncbi:hypothetical protein KJ819_03545 [Patescibacteria group bacterium]|nr:hypothetical protein [Patescibacteria group bacterium]MBU1500543.1 hypothetical protein [Patescibacteria group bacterium]MBU2080432.1 hypothetical protein [Patescibacteria group bacterium]MBU2123763.1 hypothetical protein [Patescibacteria group bacterium]MBU2194619.1 hypothetical protein [Patescibacteria group bacterium]
MRLPWLISALILAAVLALLQHVALADYLYWRYPWFDTLMHFLGGLTVACFAVGLLRKHRAQLFLVGMVAIAVGWEVFEFAIGTQREANFVFDTSLDLLMDTLGMVTVYLVARYTLWRSA